MRKFLLSISLTALLAPAAYASDYLNFYGGYFDINQDDNTAVQLGVEYRYEDIYYGLRPAVGLNVGIDDKSVYGYGGFYWDIYLSDNWIFSPNVVAGAYSHGDGKDLGHSIEFRSGLELSYQMPSENRVGVAFNHISNASIGDRNPGAETLLFIYQHPIGWFGDDKHKRSESKRNGQRWNRPAGY